VSEQYIDSIMHGETIKAQPLFMPRIICNMWVRILGKMQCLKLLKLVVQRVTAVL